MRLIKNAFLAQERGNMGHLNMPTYNGILRDLGLQ